MRAMAMYEYRCRVCDERFQVRRPMSDSALPADCPNGHVDTVRLLSMFAATRAAAGPVPVPAVSGGGGGCCGGACGCGH